MKLIKAIIIRDKIIPLNNKNLIIIGNNGSGKTYILDNIYSEIKKIVAGTDYIKKNTYYKREKILDELGIAFNNFSAVLDLDENEKNRFKDLLNNIEIYNTHEFSSKLYNLKSSITNKYNIFLENYKKFLENQVTDIYTEFDPKPKLKNSYKKEYYYQNSSHLSFYIKDLNSQIKKFTSTSVSIKIDNNFCFSKDTSNLVINFFNAKRTETSEKIKNSAEISIYSDLDNLFEEYLISQFKSNTPTKKLIIDEEFEYLDLKNSWLNKVESDLKYIFEEKNTRLSFDKFQKKIVIISGEKHFNMNNLSSGLQAVFKIYSSLLMRTKLANIDPTELLGIVVIDEIDVHLHISLQKKVLPFLTKAFPKIQFIVSTHSPFVITSTDNDSVVYDLSTGEFFEENLSRYSYEAVIKGLFHVNPISSETKESIATLKKLLNEDQPNYENIRSIVKDLIQLEKNDLLDKKVKNLYLQAINLLADHNQLEDLNV